MTFKFDESMRDEICTELIEEGDTTPTRRYCFSVALLAFFKHCDHPEARLCHGTVISSFGEGMIEHAWVETPGRAVFEDNSEHDITVVVDYCQPDPSARHTPAEFFYERTRAHNVRRFTKAEALAHARVEPTDGPWYGEETDKLIREDLA